MLLLLLAVFLLLVVSNVAFDKFNKETTNYCVQRLLTLAEPGNEAGVVLFEVFFFGFFFCTSSSDDCLVSVLTFVQTHFLFLTLLKVFSVYNSG